jgi:gluconate 2-dehydrogenase gamma chain
MNPTKQPRRHFLQRMGGVAGAAWLSAQWPAISSAAQHAHDAMKSAEATRFMVLTQSQAEEVAAIAARIIPTDGDPGATEAGVVYFIDHALHTFASEDKPAYDSGLKNVSELTSKMFPGVTRFSSATTEQQDKVLAEMSKEKGSSSQGIQATPQGSADNFFPVIYGHTVMGFLADPEAGGNRDYVGWKLIGRDEAHTFSPPFGEYDKNYPGWQAAGLAETEKK